MTLLEGRFRIGANFWSRDEGPRMWSRFDLASLRAQVEQARSIGLDTLRIFAFVPDFVRGTAGAYAIDAEMTSRMRRFVELGMDVIVSPLVGHMSGENFELPGSALFSDEAREGCRALVAAIVDALGDLPIGWALSNELPLWAGVHEGRRYPASEILSFVDAMIAAVPSGPIGLGDGVMAGFPNAAIAERVDYIGPHVYGGDLDELRQGYRYDHAIALAGRAGKPVLLEEFGGSSTQCGDREHAALWQEALYAAFSLGARGAIGWCWSDFPVKTVGREIPYEHHGFELGFGITRADGSEKPVADTLRAWRSLLDSLPDASVRAASSVALVRSSYLERDYPFSWIDRGLCERAELTAFAIASQAGLTPRIVDEDLGDASLYLLPSTQRLQTSTWLALEARVREGATLYWSWFGGDHTFHQGAWCPTFESLTGCRHRLRYGCFDFLDDTLAIGACVLPTGEREPAAAYLPIEPVHAKILISDRDRPIVVEHAIGKGRVIFAAAPLERYAARLHDGTRRGLERFYRTLVHVPAHDPRVCSRVVTVGDRRLRVIMNRSWTDVPFEADPIWSHAPMGTREGVLGPKQVIVVEA